MSAGPGDGSLARIRMYLRRHMLAYAGLGAILLAANIYVGGGWWSFWPLSIWSIVVALHFLFVKSVNVDDSWVKERAEELHLRSYDLGHIEDIEKRVENDDASVRPADER